MACRTRFWRVQAPSTRAQHARNDFKFAKNCTAQKPERNFASTSIAQRRGAPTPPRKPVGTRTNKVRRALARYGPVAYLL